MRILAIVIVILFIVVALFVPLAARQPTPQAKRRIRWDPTTYADDGTTGILKS